MAVFVSGIVMGNKDTFCFRMEDHEQELLEGCILTTAFLMRIFIFILPSTQVDFGLMVRYCSPASLWVDPTLCCRCFSAGLTV